MNKLLYAGVPSQFSTDVFAKLKENARTVTKITKARSPISHWKDGAVVFEITEREAKLLIDNNLITETKRATKYNFYVSSVHNALNGRDNTYADDIEKVFNLLNIK